MGYTDKEMRAFSQIAYVDLEKGYEYLSTMYPDQKSFSIRDVANATRMLDPDVDLRPLDCLTDAQMSDWNIAGVHDTNDSNGFYACIIETEPGSAAVGFRGSENMANPSNMANDWVLADLGLLNSACTTQQLEVHNFLNGFADQLNGYDNLAMTGHSLGGNLADYATIVSDRYGLDDNISQCVSLDGPGFSEEFIRLHQAEIDKMNGVMKHYQWSFVGTMLNRWEGSDSRCVKVSDDANTRDNKNMNMFSRHDTKYLEFDENGNVKTGDRDPLSYVSSLLSKAADELPFWKGEQLKLFLGAFMISGSFLYDSLFGKNGVINRLKDIYEKYIDGEAFKDLKDFFKKVINSFKNYIKVDTRRLSDDSGRVSDMFNEVLNNVNRMYEDVQLLNGMWTGPANRAFTDKFSVEHTQIVDYLTKLRQYVEMFEDHSMDYNRCEGRALEMIDSLNF